MKELYVSTKSKSDFLGMPFGTANGRLYKLILFHLVQKCGMDTCYRCGEIIATSGECSIEHKSPWENVSVELFWDLSNIAFSHKRCNVSAGRLGKLGTRQIRKMPGTPEDKTWCSGHQDWLPVDNFHRDRNKVGGRHDYCKECRREKKRKKVLLGDLRSSRSTTAEMPTDLDTCLAAQAVSARNRVPQP